MPANIENRKRRERRQAVHGVVFFCLLQLSCTACFAALCFIPGLPRWVVTLFAVLAAFCAVLVLPALRVLKQRFAEIEGGELDAAAEY